VSDPLKGKYHKVFSEEYRKADERLRGLDGELVPGEHDYEAFVFTAPGIKLIFYPHKTKSTGNVHIRVRSAGKADQKVLRKAIFALAENSCTFQYPMDHKLHSEAVSESIRKYGG
jgi:hypothetical protein